jgi:hypothetical protein
MFPVTVSTFYRGVGGKLYNQLVFLTTCDPYTAKNPWSHNSPGDYLTHPLTQIGAQDFEKLSLLSLLT